MGINGIGGISGVSGVYGKKGDLKVNKTAQIEPKKDVAAISKAGKDFAIAMKAVRQSPDVREEKVAEIKSKIENGEYNVSGKDIAEKLIEKLVNKKA